MSTPPAPSDLTGTTDPAAGPERTRRPVATWRPGGDTLVAALSLVTFWLCYWAGTTWNIWALWAGIVVVGTVVPAVTVLWWRREGLAGLGVRRGWLLTSLVVSALLGAGSAYRLVTLAGEQGVPVAPHLLGNLLVLWEPLFVFGWLYLRWERAFGWLPAIALTGAGFALQHVGAVPLATALGFGAFAVVFAVVFALVRNLVVLWPLFYPVASGIGTLQAGVAFAWSDVAPAAVLLVIQVIIVLGVWSLARRSEGFGRGAAGRRR